MKSITNPPPAARLPLLAALGAGAIALLSAGPARADQFVLFDATFTYTWQNATTSTPSKSHYYVTETNWLNKARPTNWVSPVNYRAGTVHIRVEVFEKPAGNQRVGWGLCYIANQGGYGCPYTDYYTTTGVFEKDVAMTNFWNNNTIQWDRGVKQMDLVYTINDSGSGHVHNFPNLQSQTTPTRLRITLVQVSQGDTYKPIAPPADGGAGSDAGADATAPADAGSDGGAGGTGGSGAGGSGSGGATGSGGAGPASGTGGASGGSSSGGATGNAGSGGRSTSTGGSGPAPSASSSASSSGCSVGSVAYTANAGPVGLALAALGLVLRRRRRRR